PGTTQGRPRRTPRPPARRWARADPCRDHAAAARAVIRATAVIGKFHLNPAILVTPSVRCAAPIYRTHVYRERTTKDIKERPMQEDLVVRRETPAPPAAVFALLTDPQNILRWMGTEAQVEPEPQRHRRSLRPRFLPRGRAGAPIGLQLWLGRQRGGPSGVEPGRDRPHRAAGRDAPAPDPYWPAECRAMRRACGRLGALPRPAGRSCGRARPGPGPLARPHRSGVTAFRSRAFKSAFDQRAQ